MGTKMLQYAKCLLEDKDNLVAIDKYFDKLLTSLNTAVAIENKLDNRLIYFPIQMKIQDNKDRL